MIVRQMPDFPEDAPHVATYTRNAKTGMYNVRVTGPKADRFAGQEVPVSTKSGEEHMEKLTNLIWRGRDDLEFPDHKASFMPVAIYEFEQRPREPEPPAKFR